MPRLATDPPKKRLIVLCLLCSIGLMVFLQVADRAIPKGGSAPLALRAEVDEAGHAINAAVLFLPCFLLDRRLWPYMLLAFMAGWLLDLDHFIAGNSFSLHAAARLEMRPATHSLTFALACGLAVGVLLRHRAAGLVIGLALVAHVLRDATGESRLLYPLPWLNRIPAPIYYAAEVVLVFVGSLALWSVWRGRAAPSARKDD